MSSIFNEEDWKGIELRGGDHIYSRYDTESDRMRYFYVSADETSKQGIGKELYDFLYEEQTDWSVKGDRIQT